MSGKGEFYHSCSTGDCDICRGEKIKRLESAQIALARLTAENAALRDVVETLDSRLMRIIRLIESAIEEPVDQGSLPLALNIAVSAKEVSADAQDALEKR